MNSLIRFKRALLAGCRAFVGEFRASWRRFGIVPAELPGYRIFVGATPDALVEVWPGVRATGINGKIYRRELESLMATTPCGRSYRPDGSVDRIWGTRPKEQ